MWGGVGASIEGKLSPGVVTVAMRFDESLGFHEKE